MYNLIGLSHLVFTTNKKNFKESKFLNQNFSSLGVHVFDHYDYKKKLLRNSTKILSEITLYKSKDLNLPAFEFILSNNNVCRPNDTYGIINKKLKNFNSLSREIYFSNNNLINSSFCPQLNLNVCNDTDLIRNKTGMWFKVFDFIKYVHFFKRHLKLFCYYEDNYKAIFTTRIINRALTKFDILIFKSEEKQSYFNDDLGLSTLGWITKNLVKKIENYHVTEPFNIKLDKNEFLGQFSYDNSFISNEFLKINYERNRK